MRRPFSCALVLAAVLSGAACEERAPAPPDRPSEPERPARLDLDAAVGEVEDAGELDAGAEARRLVAELRRSKLDVAPRRVPTQRLAFGKNRLAQLTENELVVRDTKDWKELARVAVSGARRVGTLADGSVLAAGVSDVWHVPRDPKKAERFSRVPLFPDSLLLGDRRDKKKLWVHHGIDPTLYPYELGEAGRLETLDFVELPKADQKAFAQLKDGSYVYTAGSKLERFFPGGRRWSLALPPGADVWRILTTRRLDRIWLALADGKLTLMELGESTLAEKKSLDVSGAFDLASNDAEIAVLALERESSEAGAAAPRRAWKLLVIDVDGNERMATALPLGGTTSGDDWVRELTKNRGVVLSTSEPLVAVGGPSWLAVWRTRDGKQVLAP
jgi:hypothetical protein